MNKKHFKDPIYGYVEIDLAIVSKIIDTNIFQRLRNIRQTSYAPLYSAALHNRFIHSLGVYHLGQIVSSKLCDSIPDSILDEAAKQMISKTFELACLLHDVGHSPFSHSGENFYLTYGDLYSELKTAVKDDAYSKTVDSRLADKKVANPHEIMSVIVAINNFGDVIEQDNFDFFARCITGYTYDGDTSEEKIKNCFISMLNSDIIDVDKLDYLIRDSYVTGYDNVIIDYKRLLNSIMISSDEKFQLMYHKNALSVIENVVYARDAEKKWIQNHPSVLYEIFLVQHAIKRINNEYEDNGKHLFCYDALTEDGISFADSNKKVCLLSDDDITTISKNDISDDLIKEFYARNIRRHPIWKSEAEYQSLFRRTLGEELLDKLELDMDALVKFIEDSQCKLPVINDETLSFFENQIKQLRESKEIDENIKSENIKGIEANLKWFYILKKYANDNNIKFDFVIIMADIFRSGFSKKALEEILIYFPEFKKVNYLKDVTSLFQLKETRDNYFYIFYKRKNTNCDFICNECENTCYIDVANFTKYIRDNVE